MQCIVFAILLLAATLMSASAASVSRAYNYFSISGMTLPEIEDQLRTRGPRVEKSGQRHPGATNMKFTTEVKYAETERHCRIADARVSVQAKVTLPHWRDRRRAETGMRLIWDTLARDIKRHEDSHVSIAKNHVRMLEDVLLGLTPRRNCRALAARVEKATADVLAKHDAAQERFDRIEAINFERRIMRLLKYRVEQIEAGRLEP